MAVVVDASAFVELLVRSPAGATVESAILSTVAFAPELLDVEVASALSGLERGGKMPTENARTAIDALLGAPITRVPHAGLIEGAWIRQRSLSVYDGLYVSLAARLGCPLITADRRLARGGLDVPVTLVAT